MILSLGFLLAGLISSPSLAAECDRSLDGIRKYEFDILHAATSKGLSDAMDCLFDIQKNADPDTRYMANAYLRVILGGPLVKEIPPNPRYRELSKKFEELGVEGDQTAQNFAAGDWQFYKLFCEEGDVSHCATMVPDEERIQKQTPLLAASSLMHLRQAYLVLTGEQKKQIGGRIKSLYGKIPKSDKLQRRFIERIYEELFGPEIPVSMWS